MSINWYDGVNNKPPRPEELREGQNVPGCGKVIYSDDLTFMGGSQRQDSGGSAYSDSTGGAGGFDDIDSIPF